MSTFYPILFRQSLGKEIKGISSEAYQALMDYDYPGNVRELANIIESAMVIADGEYIELKDLPDEVRKDPPLLINPADVELV